MPIKCGIYHFTDKSEKRPKVCSDQINELKKIATSLGYTDFEIFCDKSLLRCEHPEFDRFLSSSDQFDALITKDFYHISKNTMKCMSIMKELYNKGIKIYTQRNGAFTYSEEEPFNKTLRVATYACRFGEPNEIKQILKVQNDILSLFIKKKTNWTIDKQYSDESQHQKDGEQQELINLIKNKENYDLIVVHNLNDLHWRTANFCKIREQLQLDIYSLQEGLLKYNKGENV